MHATPGGTRFTTATCVGAIGLLSSLSAVGTLGSPTLLHQPLVLVLLSPRLPFLAIAAGRVPPVLLVPLGVARLCAGDVFHFHLGVNGVHRRLADNRVLHHRRVLRARNRIGHSKLVARARARVHRCEPLVRHSVLVAVLLRPIGRHLAIAGASGACPRRVALADVAGTVAYVLVIVLGAGSFTH